MGTGIVREEQGFYILETANTTYAFALMETGHLEHLYYGRKISMTGNALLALRQKTVNINGSAIVYSSEHGNVGLDDICLEISGVGKGDFRQPFLEIVMPDGSRTTDFVFESHEITEETASFTTLPSSYDEIGTASTLTIKMKERNRKLSLELRYTVFPDCDCITRSTVLKNDGEEAVMVERMMSLQLDLPDSSYSFTTFKGDWVREMERSTMELGTGRIVNASNTGNSSNRANPFVMLHRPEATEQAGECYAANLIYSGNHYEAVEVSTHGKARLLTGINPETFCFRLQPGDCLESPEAVITYSAEGFEGISHHMHQFVREHIVRGQWKYRERPVLLNSWEASYFKFNENKLLKLAKAGKEAGIELFVMDDGWFGKRDDDTSSLGDWTVNKKKLPGGIKGLSEKIRGMGMQFGIWVEPEMVNEDSDLYRRHPDWAVTIPGREHSQGRNQMLLDFTREDVRENIIKQMSRVFAQGEISYVKWDMNRNFSDVYSHELSQIQQGEFSHRYIMGLYQVMKALTEKFPHILFESCASGGNRFDLGMLCYMPQVWASDNSDAISRLMIQGGYSYGYPQSVIGAHVSDCPNHQTLRNTSLATRFHVAAFGVLGYECNLCEMPKEELAEIKEQIRIYKKRRKTLQYGRMYRLEEGNVVKWMVVSDNQEEAVGIMVQKLVRPHSSYECFKTRGLDDEKCYRFTNRILKYDIRQFGGLVNIISPVHIKKDSLVHHTVAHFIKMDGEIEDVTVSGSLLNHAGIKLSQGFAGTGYGENTRLFQDFDSRMYFIDRVQE